jgi:V/A-type H+-transporting ATPase subunit E
MQMENKVQEITDKIYREGVEKGETEAQKIIETAEEKKADILKTARHEAEKIIADAKKNAEELTKHTHSELQMYAKRAAEALKSEIADMLTNALVDTAVSQTINNEWMQKLMLTLATEWVQKENIAIQTANADALTQYFAKHAKDLLNNSVKIEQVNGKNAAFTIMPSHKGYKIQFGEAEFAAYFKEFLRPQLVEMLFKQ